MIRSTGSAAGSTPTAHPESTRSISPASRRSCIARTRREPPSNRAASLLSATHIRQVSSRSRSRGASTTSSLSLCLSVSLARARASGSAARPSRCRGAFTADARSRAAAAPSFAGPLHRPGAGITAGTERWSVVRHLLPHSASWRTLDFLGHRIQRHLQRGGHKRFVYTYPSKAALAAVKAKVRTITRRRPARGRSRRPARPLVRVGATLAPARVRQARPHHPHPPPRHPRRHPPRPVQRPRRGAKRDHSTHHSPRFRFSHSQGRSSPRDAVLRTHHVAATAREVRRSATPTFFNCPIFPGVDAGVDTAARGRRWALGTSRR